jgi:biotin operon repressor
LLALIHTGTFSSHAIAGKLGVSEQTIYRDILCLKQQGHPIRSVKHSSHWAYEIAERATVRESVGEMRP